MFRDHQISTPRIIVLGTIIVVIIWSIILAFYGVSANILVTSMIRIGIVVFVLSLLWNLLDKYLWHHKLFRGWLITTPDLRGRWIGYYISGYFKDKENERGKILPLALEITQSLTRISCISYGPGSRGESFSAKILSDLENKEFKLSYIYHAKREVTTSVPGDEHEGVVILRLIKGNDKVLKGIYFNDREPAPVKGDMYLKWDSINLKGSLS